MLWHIGNTTVRTPYRLKAALAALQGTPLNGNLYGREAESAFAKLLHDTDVVNVARLEEGDNKDVSDLGRKWRSALSQLGFITHKVDDDLLRESTGEIDSLTGRSFEITPNGYRLINAEQTTAQQECFLRSLLAYQIPSVIEPRYACNPFSPLKFVIDIFFSLTERGAEGYISFVEFALFIQTSSPEDGIDSIVNEIISYRQRKSFASGKIREFHKGEYSQAVYKTDPKTLHDKIDTKSQTLDDYADLSLRYLKATGIFRSYGHGITISASKEQIAKIIHQSAIEASSQKNYLLNLWKGAILPTDQEETAIQVINDLSQKIEAKGQSVTISSTIEVSQQRHILEEQLIQLEELEYYRSQASQLDDISAWIETLLGRSAILPDGTKPKIPRGEAPAYFEWIIWRAFLAINSLVNQPWEARRFQIDQDFLPISTAPGNGPDLVFEFENAIIVVEVTLTSSSRQEAAEGEPVRRHVAKYVEAQNSGGKPVFGLFLAINIDSNTAHTFRTGDWYLKDDTKTNLHIVPMKLDDFLSLFNFGKTRLENMPSILQEVIRSCRMEATQDAPAWKATISNIISRTVATDQ